MRRSDRPVTSRHIMVYDEDWEYLDALYGRGNGPGAVGTGVAIRKLIHKWVKGMKAKALQEEEE